MQFRSMVKDAEFLPVIRTRDNLAVRYRLSEKVWLIITYVCHLSCLSLCVYMGVLNGSQQMMMSSTRAMSTQV